MEMSASQQGGVEQRVVRESFIKIAEEILTGVEQLNSGLPEATKVSALDVTWTAIHRSKHRRELGFSAINLMGLKSRTSAVNQQCGNSSSMMQKQSLASESRPMHVRIVVVRNEDAVTSSAPAQLRLGEELAQQRVQL
jgi:hypothetical protein